MRRAWHFLALSVLPVAGLATLVVAFVRTHAQPRSGEPAELQARFDALLESRQALMVQEPASPDELTDRLPRTLTVGGLLQRIEAAARRAGVRAVSFGSEDGKRAGRSAALGAAVASTDPDAGTEVEPVDSGSGALASGSGALAEDLHPEHLRCQITVEADFGALVQFLGLLETTPAVTRVRSLQVVPRAQGVSATVGLEGYAYSGDGTEAVVPAAPSQGGR
ncbi:MAG: hypothetical protein R3F56_16445 [Planctomycetota bacterium]